MPDSNNLPVAATFAESQTDTEATPAATESVDRAAAVCRIECGDISLPSEGAITLQIRRVNATNYTTLTINADGSADIKETIAEVEGEALGSCEAEGITDAADLTIIDDAGEVSVLSDGAEAFSATLTDHAEAVLVYIAGLGTGGALSELTTYAGADTTDIIAFPPGHRGVLIHLPATLATGTAALLVLVASGASWVPVDGYDEASASAEPMHIKCAATNARSKRLPADLFYGIDQCKLKAVASDLSTAVVQAVGGDVELTVEACRY